MIVRRKIRKILALLSKEYGRPRPFRRTKPIDELVRTILSQNTTDKNSLKAFAILKDEFNSWDKLLRVGIRRLAGLIRHAGLANIKAKRIKEALGEIKRREGKMSLSRLKNLKVKESRDYLMSLKGVGPKTAACVLLFSFNKPIMPVDTHIFRVTKRLGLLIEKRINIIEAHAILSKIVPKHLIYKFHLGIIEHGRRTCRAQNPKCGMCIVYNLCRFEDKRKFYDT